MHRIRIMKKFTVMEEEKYRVISFSSMRVVKRTVEQSE